MDDYGHRMTEYELSKLERKIKEVYADVKDDINKRVAAYFKKFSKQDEEKRQQVDDGEMTRQEYINWRLRAMGRGAEYEDMRTDVATKMTDTKKTALTYASVALIGIYALNRNYAAYRIESTVPSVSFVFMETSAMRRLFTERPDLMPYYSPIKAFQRGFDVEYGKRQITKVVTSGILQGKSIPKIADDLQMHIVDMSQNSAIRAARTAVTSAENGGRVDAYKEAEDMGIEMEQQWVATLDDRTRHSHVLLDGESIEVGGTFSNGCRFPGDPLGAPEEVYNCRCTLIPVVKKFPRSSVQRANRLGDMTYEEWKRGKGGSK